MASGMYNKAIQEMAKALIDLDTDTLKIMLVGSGYTFDPDHDTVNQASGSEISVSGYTGGFGGAGRKTVTITVNENDTNNRADVVIGDLTWTALATGATVAGAILIKEAGGADSGSRLIAYFDLTDTPTNGGDFTLDFSASGNILIG